MDTDHLADDHMIGRASGRQGQAYGFHKLASSTMGTGDRYVIFEIERDDFELAMEGRVVGVIIPDDVDGQSLDQLLGEVRDAGGVRFVVVPPGRTD